MAEHLSRTITTATLVTVGAALAVSAAAQTLSDPTQPPASVLEPAVRGEEASEGPQLQSVLISPTRRIAVIDGKAVALGEKVGEARVIRITDRDVTLKNGKDVQVLKLFPQIEKRPVAGAQDRKAEVKSK